MNAEELKKLRKKSGLTQIELGDLCGMHPQTIKGYEGGMQVIPAKKAELLYYFLKKKDISMSNKNSITYNIDADKMDVIIEMMNKLNVDIEFLKSKIDSQSGTDKKSTK